MEDDGFTLVTRKNKHIARSKNYIRDKHENKEKRYGNANTKYTRPQHRSREPNRTQTLKIPSICLDFPHDILKQIFSFIDVKSLVTAARVCKKWNGVSDNDVRRFS